MVADGHIFVVRKQRIVGTELLADVGCVMDADIEIGIVADEAGHMNPDLALPEQLSLEVVAISFSTEDLSESLAKVPHRLLPSCERCVEDWLGKVLARVVV